MTTNLEMEVSRIDCRLYDNHGYLKHFFTLDRVGIDTVMVVGVTVPVKTIMKPISVFLKSLGFRYVKFERIGPDVSKNRIVTVDLSGQTKMKIERV